MANRNYEKFNPETMENIVIPIAHEITDITKRNESIPYYMMDQYNSNTYDKKALQKCVHFKFVDGRLQGALVPTETEGVFVCKCCKRKINLAFDNMKDVNNDIKKLTDAIEVINKVLFFGIANGLNPEGTQLLINLKMGIADAGELTAQLGKFVSYETENMKHQTSIGGEYRTDDYSNTFSNYRG